MPSPDDAPTLLAAIEAEQARLRELLAGKDDAVLARRHPDGRWTVLENLRHLLFAEQGHLGDFNPGREWSPLVLPPPGIQKREPFRSNMHEPADAAEVLEAWWDAHAANRPYLRAESEPMRKALAKNLRHLRNHIVLIERELRRKG